MKKVVLNRLGGKNTYVADLLINRLLPDEQVAAVGPIILLDHVYPSPIDHKKRGADRGKNAHPHRGIATFSYLFSGALEHSDSAGNTGVIEAGEGQWMKSGSGIIHEERIAPEFRRSGGVFHGLQFWINLPAAAKAEAPEYFRLGAADIPEAELPGFAGSLRVLIGNCGRYDSPVKTYHGEFIYHLKLNPKSKFLFHTKEGLEYAFFIPSKEIRLNGELAGNSELLIPDNEKAEILFDNPGITVADVIIFGGKPYTEAIIAQGPFVMNTSDEIALAYRDFFDGVYGELSIPKP
jgi:redox-sensitive bicupin YhaK (pirin superfamily)